MNKEKEILQNQATNLTLENQKLKRAVKEMFELLGNYDAVATKYRVLVQDNEDFYNQIYDEVFEETRLI